MDFLSEYIEWHYFKAWLNIIAAIRNIILFPIYLFSVPVHLHTLILPWKKEQMQDISSMNIKDVANAVLYNIISRSIGFIMRSLMILSGLFFSILTLPAILFGILWPVMIFISIPLFLWRKKDENEIINHAIHASGNSLNKLFNAIFSTHFGIFLRSRMNFNPSVFILGKYPSEGEIFLRLYGTPDLDWQKLFRILLYDSDVMQIVEREKIKVSLLLGCIKWYEEMNSDRGKPLIFDFQRIRRIRGIGFEWAYAYTPLLDEFSTALSKKATPYPVLIGRESEIKAIENILLKTSDNSCICIGEPGVGRHVVLWKIASRINSLDCPGPLKGKRIVLLDMNRLLSSEDTMEKAKGKLESAFKEAEYAGNIIIVIDELDKYVSAMDGRTDLSGVISVFAQSELSIIGITTNYNYHKYIEPNSSVRLIFEKIFISEPDETMIRDELLLSSLPVLERKYKVFITFEAVIKCIFNCEKFLKDKTFPSKAFEALENCAVWAESINSTVLTGRLVDEYFSQKLHIRINISVAEAGFLLHLEDELHRRVINQDLAIRAISSALRRSRAGISNAEKPMGSFLFLGPTGVGKTETAKALSSILFTGQGNMIRFDMSQFRLQEGMDTLLGSVSKGQAGLLPSALRDNPYSVLLLDEFEKSTKDVFNIFLTLLDEGYISDSFGKKVYANNNIIIATSNAGSEYIREEIVKGTDLNQLRKGLVDYVLKKNIFTPELINRFDEVIVFTPLSEGHLREVTAKMLDSLNKRLREKEIRLEIHSSLIRSIIASGYDPQFGARGIARYISENIEDDIAKKIISGSLKSGDVLRL